MVHKTKRYLIILIVLLFIFSSLAVVSFVSSNIKTGNAPAGIFYELPITLTNAQGTPTPANLQVLLKMDWATYSSYESTNPPLSNIKFYNSSWQPLYAWLENNATKTATSSNVWINLAGNIIPANNGSIKIYLAFFSTTVNNFSPTGYWGEAPYQSGTYGEYDNGAEVFDIYANGNTNPSLFNTYFGVSLAQATNVSYGSGSINALYITGDSGETDTIQAEYTIGTSITNIIAEDNFQYLKTNGADNGVLNIANSNYTDRSTNAIGVEMGIDESYFYQAYIFDGFNTNKINEKGSFDNNWDYASVTELHTSDSFYGYISPKLYSPADGFDGTVYANPLQSASSLYIGLGITGTGGWSSWNTYINWMRARTYPPNGVLPSVSFGSVHVIGSPSRTYKVTFTESGLSSGTSWSVTFDGDNVGSTTTYIQYTGIARGNYTFNAPSLRGYTVSPSSGNIKIKNSNAIQTIIFTALAGGPYQIGTTFYGLTNVSIGGFACANVTLPNIQSYYEGAWQQPLLSQLNPFRTTVIFYVDNSNNLDAFFVSNNTTTTLYDWTYIDTIYQYNCMGCPLSYIEQPNGSLMTIFSAGKYSDGNWAIEQYNLYNKTFTFTDTGIIAKVPTSISGQYWEPISYNGWYCMGNNTYTLNGLCIFYNIYSKICFTGTGVSMCIKGNTDTKIIGFNLWNNKIVSSGSIKFEWSQVNFTTKSITTTRPFYFNNSAISSDVNDLPAYYEYLSNGSILMWEEMNYMGYNSHQRNLVFSFYLYNNINNIALNTRSTELLTTPSVTTTGYDFSQFATQSGLQIGCDPANLFGVNNGTYVSGQSGLFYNMLTLKRYVTTTDNWLLDLFNVHKDDLQATQADEVTYSGYMQFVSLYQLGASHSKNQFCLYWDPTNTTEFITVPPARTYNISLSETGLAGTKWYVNITSRNSYSSTSSTINFSLSNGTYYSIVSTVNKIYSPNPNAGMFTVNGNAYSKTIF